MSIQSKKISLLVRFSLACLFMPACSTVWVEIPNNRFLLPENEGSLGAGHVGLAYGSKSKVIVIDEVQSEEPKLDQSKILPSDGFAPQLAVGLIPAVDLVWTSTGLGAKWQFLGNPRKTAQVGNFSMAAAMLYGTYEANFSTGSEGVVDERKGRGEAKWFDFALLAGYRVAEKSLLYSSVGNTFYQAKGELTKIDGERVNHYLTDQNRGQVITLHGGARHHWKSFYVQVEPGIAYAQYRHANDHVRFVFGGALGWQW